MIKIIYYIIGVFFMALNAGMEACPPLLLAFE
jgi:hypothetical protein